MKVLVLGGGGMLGHKMVHTLVGSGELEVHASVRSLPVLPASGVVYHTGVDVGPASSSLHDLLGHLAPDVIINAVGAIKQKDLKSQVEDTLHANALLPHLLAFLNPNRNGRIIHFSTDCVFVGDRGKYRQAEAPDALDLYGRSKALGEVGYGPHLTLRTSIVGFELSGFLGLASWVLKQPRGSTIKGFTRAIYSGLPTVTVSRLVRDLLVSRSDLSGLFHVASEPIDKFDLIQRLNVALDLGLEIVPDDSFVMDRSLNDDEFRAATGTTRPTWQQLIEEMRIDFQALPYNEIYHNLRSIEEGVLHA